MSKCWRSLGFASVQSVRGAAQTPPAWRLRAAAARNVDMDTSGRACPVRNAQSAQPGPEVKYPCWVVPPCRLRSRRCSWSSRCAGGAACNTLFKQQWIRSTASSTWSTRAAPRPGPLSRWLQSAQKGRDLRSLAASRLCCWTLTVGWLGRAGSIRPRQLRNRNVLSETQSLAKSRSRAAPSRSAPKGPVLMPVESTRSELGNHDTPAGLLGTLRHLLRTRRAAAARIPLH
jgi:hypothetical protein